MRQCIPSGDEDGRVGVNVLDACNERGVRRDDTGTNETEAMDDEQAVEVHNLTSIGRDTLVPHNTDAMLPVASYLASEAAAAAVTARNPCSPPARLVTISTYVNHCWIRSLFMPLFDRSKGQ